MVVLMKRFLLTCSIAVLAASLSAQPDDTRKPGKVVSIMAERFAFSPSKVRVKQGTVVEFVIASDDTDHGFRIPAANIDVAIPQQGKGEVRVRFPAREKGVFAFECSRPCGAGHNLMRGSIVVE
jgi:heme/copper-type cytochrome/quinol oxidase subunit 2